MATCSPSMRPRFFADGVQVEQCLGGVFVARRRPALMMQDRSRSARKRGRRPAELMPQHDDVHVVGLED